jgi:serine protease Do
LRNDDVIVSINGTPVHDMDELFVTVGTLLAGSEARLEVSRLRDLVPVTLAKSYVPGKIVVTNRPPAVKGCRVDYTSVLLLQFEVARGMWGQSGIQPGVYVREVEPGSSAAKAGLKENDVITHVNGQPVASPDEFYKEANKQTGDLKLTLASTDGHKTFPQVTLH